MAYIARTSGAREEIPADVRITLEYAQEVVGGYVELICPLRTPEVVFLCDEDGLPKRLPHNQHGSDLYGPSSIIVGDIIVMTRREARKHAWL